MDEIDQADFVPQWHLEGTARFWGDVLPGPGITAALFSEKFVHAMVHENVCGAEFYEAQVTQIAKSIVADEPPPKYYWIKADGILYYDGNLARDDKGYVPREIFDEGGGFVHMASDRGEDLKRKHGIIYTTRPRFGPRTLGGSDLWHCHMVAGTIEVIEACRKHGIGNLLIVPIDYQASPWARDKRPEFGIDLFGAQWPPQWYPAGFEPLASNQVSLKSPREAVGIVTSPPIERDLTLDELGNGASTRWKQPQPIDWRRMDAKLVEDWRTVNMSEQDVDMLEKELNLVVPDFLRHWLLLNPFASRDSDTRALMCSRDHVIDDNVKLRRDGYYGRLWPESLLYIGDDWGGGAYFVDTKQAVPMVYYYDWESDEGDTVLPEYSKAYTDDEFLEEIAG